jgi:hypothetical protein
MASGLAGFGPGITDAQITAVKGAVMDELKDPESARFSGIEACGTTRVIIVCGLVNAKNSYGG